MNKEEIKEKIKKNTNWRYPFDEFWFNIGWDKCEEEFNKKLEELKKKSYPVHFCETKKCKCYNPKAKENNAIIIELEEINKIFKEENQNE